MSSACSALWQKHYAKDRNQLADAQNGGAVVKTSDGQVEDVRVGLTNMASVPLRAEALEAALRGQPASAESIAKAAEEAAEGTEPPADLNATPDYKRHLARVLARRALEKAAGLSS